MSKEIKYKFDTIDLKHAPKKDKHLAVCLSLIWDENEKGPGYWKLNSKLMELPEYTILIKRLAKDAKENYPYLDGRMRWELFKINTQDCSIKMGKARAREQKLYIKNLQKSIDDLLMI